MAVARGTRAKFDEVRERLYAQYEDAPFDPATGPGLEGLRSEVDSYLEAHRAEPRAVRKANVFRIVLARGRICIDPVDRFADKLEHGGIVRGLQKEWLS
ncbi:MAG: hypothetical protein ACYTFI_03185 [Planctomycetota bacterium]